MISNTLITVFSSALFLFTGSANLIDNAVVVEGTSAADTIDVRQIGDQLNVIINGASQGLFDLTDEVRVRGLGGDDVINFQVGITATAIVDGGSGDDTIRTGSGNDFVDGGLGNDTIFSRGGDDFINGGVGEDTIRAQAGDDSVVGGLDDDNIYGGTGNDMLDGGLDADFIAGDGGCDELFGRSGDDVLIGGAGPDFLDGGLGHDTANDIGEIEVSIECSLQISRIDRFDEIIAQFRIDRDQRIHDDPSQIRVLGISDEAIDSYRAGLLAKINDPTSDGGMIDSGLDTLAADLEAIVVSGFPGQISGIFDDFLVNIGLVGTTTN